MKKKILIYIGIVIAAIFSLACGVIVDNALITIFDLQPGLLLYFLLILFFVAVFCTNFFRMFKVSVPEVLVDMFGHEKLFHGLTKMENDEQFSTKRKVALTIGLAFSSSVGILFGAMTYKSVFVVAKSIGFSQAALSGSPIKIFAISLALTAFLCFTSLILKSLATILRKPNLSASIKDSLHNLVSCDARLRQNKNKTERRILIERTVSVMIFAILVPIIGLGLLMTLNACAMELSKIFVSNDLFSPFSAKNISQFLAFFLAFPGQFIFAIRTSYITTTRFFIAEEKIEQKTSSQAGYLLLINNLLKPTMEILRIINAIGNGFIAMMGANGIFMMIIAGAGNTMGNYAAAVKDEKKTS